MLNCFGPVRSGENIIGSVQGQGNKIYYFLVQFGLPQKITGQYRVGVPKTLPRRTQVCMWDKVDRASSKMCVDVTANFKW